MTRRELMEKMDYAEFKEWMIFYHVEPWGCIEEDKRTASIVSMIANTHRKKGRSAFQIKDFLPKRNFPSFGKRVLQSVETMKTTLMSIMRAQNKKVQKEEEKKNKGE